MPFLSPIKIQIPVTIEGIDFSIEPSSNLSLSHQSVGETTGAVEENLTDSALMDYFCQAEVSSTRCPEIFSTIPA